MHGQLGSLEGEKGRRVGFAIANTPVNQTTAQDMAHMAAQGDKTPGFPSTPHHRVCLLPLHVSMCVLPGVQ